MKFFKLHLVTLSFLITILLFTSAVEGNQRQVEVLEFSSGEISRIENSVEIQQLAKTYIHSIHNLSVKFNPIPKEGKAIKIPLDPAIKVQNKWIKGLISEVIIIFDKNGESLLMLYDDENRSYFFEFTADTTELHSFITP